MVMRSEFKVSTGLYLYCYNLFCLAETVCLALGKAASLKRSERI